MYRILIADDEQLERKALESIITEHFGEMVEIRQAVNGRDAVEAAREFSPDITMLDIKMPIMNGIEAGKEILEFLPECHIIMLTGFTYFTYAKESVNIGAADFLVKPASDEDVIEALKKAVKQVDMRTERRRDEEANRKKAMQAEQYMESELVLAIAFSNADEELIREQMEGLGLSFSYAVGAVMDVQPAGEGEAFMTARECRDCISSLKFDGRICFCERYHKIYLLILTEEGKSREWYKDLLKRLSALVEKQGYHVRLATGIQVSQLKNIYLSFQEAKRNLNGGKRINVHRKEEGAGMAGSSQGEQERRLVSYLKAGDYDEAMLYLEQLMELFFEENLEPVMRIYELLVVVNRSLPQDLEVMPVFALFKEMAAETRRERIMGLASEYVENIIDSFIAKEGRDDLAWAAKAEDYIQANYMKNITLEDMAGQTGFSIYYFSKLFKQKFHMNFVDYLTSVRMQKAKRMLEQGEASVKEVSSRVGYSEANYFARVFKKEIGVPPSIYQKNDKLSK